jgi:hypothetical protein
MSCGNQWFSSHTILSCERFKKRDKKREKSFFHVFEKKVKKKAFKIQTDMIF